ncbi:phBC6A51 family helix-turn-helix protein [Peribacillus loiseleuriae]|uniref:phBC6A51 family helix-turn-helix protein n=1 Tax=Peribacillus loiseleuriae TaxID=1679170 RepID=UPI00380A33C7
MEENHLKLKLKQEKVIMALLTEPTHSQAAKKAGVGETTLYRWLDDEEFNKAFKDARRKAFSQSISHLQQATASAVETLKDVMENEESPASSRVSAAKTVLEMAFKAYEMEDLVAQIDEMQQYIEEVKVAAK